MHGTVTLLHPDGQVELFEIDGPPNLTLMQSWVGGFIELVPGLTRREDARCVAFCNEEGIDLGLAFNPLATEVWHAACPMHRGSRLLGNVVIIEGDDELLGAL